MFRFIKIGNLHNHNRGINMVGINVRDGEPIDRALKRFKQKCQHAGIQKDVKRISFYQKPSERKKMAQNIARRKYKKLTTG